MDYKEQKETEEQKIDWRKREPKIGDILTMLKLDGAYDDMVNWRTEKEALKRHYKNVFDVDVNINSKTIKTQLFKSFIARLVVELQVRKLQLPVIDIEATTKSKKAYDQKTKASMTKAVWEWFSRESGYECVANEAKEDQVAFGDRFLQPFVRKIAGTDKVFPAVTNVKSENVMLDPNCNNLKSENYAEAAQFWAVTNTYSKKQLKSRFGDWILDWVKPGWMVDENLGQTWLKRSKSTQYYEVLEIQDKSEGMELVLVGSSAFPVICRGMKMKKDEQINALLEDEECPMVWTEEYPYKNSFGENILTGCGAFMYFDPDKPRNFGVVRRTAILQVVHEIVENLKIDNIIKRLDKIVYLLGGSNKTDQTLQSYRQERLTNRNVVWNIPQNLGKEPVTPGVLSFEGLTAQEGEEITQGVMNLTRNSVGVDPQQLEVQKNTAVTQTQIIEEKSTEAIDDIANKNVPGLIDEVKTMLYFCIAHEGFGLDEVILQYTKYDEITPEGNPHATISVKEACKQIKDFAYSVIVDKSTLIKKSRVIESENLLKFLQLVNPQATPEWYIGVGKSLAQVMGITLPEISKQQAQQITPTGGNSQFQPSQNTPPQQPPMQ